MKILLVDDEAAILFLLKAALERAGHIVETAFSGAQALERTGPFDLVITDWVMPEMHGVVLMQKLKERQPGLKVIITTGYTDEDTQAAIRKAGADGFLPKPSTPAEILRLIAEACTPVAA